MALLKLHFKTSFRSEATFDGAVEPMGATGYKFSGTLNASCPLYRNDSGFQNTVRIGHGGSKSWAYMDLILEKPSENTFTVECQGERAANETVDFTLGFNEGLSGQFTDGNRTTVAVD
jgi:hypothetical protein